MIWHRRHARLVLLTAAIAASAVHGAQPYYTDDASILETGACQLETTRLDNRAGHELSLAAACNLTGNLELELGGARTSEPGSRDTLYSVQGKGLFRELETNSYGVGWLAGARWRGGREPDQKKISDYYASVLFSRSFDDDRFIAHVNLGVQADRDRRHEFVTWGINGELPLRGGLTLIGELYSNERSRSFHQVGLRFALIPDHVEIDASIGGENGHRRTTRWWTIGLRLVSTPFFK